MTGETKTVRGKYVLSKKKKIEGEISGENDNYRADPACTLYNNDTYLLDMNE